MFVQAEPNGLLMVRYKLYFNQQHPDPEDAWVLTYLQEHNLAPRRQLDETHDGVLFKVLHFGQCYLGRHIRAIGALYRRGIEHTALAERIKTLLAAADEATIRTAIAKMNPDTRHDMTTDLTARLHATAHFEPTGDNDLRAEIEASAVMDAFKTWQRPAQEP